MRNPFYPFKNTKPARYCLLVAVMFALAGLTGCATSVRKLDISQGGVNLHIPDRGWDPQNADFVAGWCGESSIQMALAFYGKEIPQDVIHKAGKPKHTDLRSQDMNRTLKALGATFVRFDRNDTNQEDFIAWIQDQLKQGHPVICGCKMYPTDDPDNDIDHFVVISGYNPKGLLMNTQMDMDGQILETYGQLASKHSRYSFNVDDDLFWGRAITGVQ